MDALPKLDQNEFRQWMQSQVEQLVESLSEAVDSAQRGRVIRDSEEKARDVLDDFRRRAYEKALQLKVDAAEAAFPPSPQRRDESPQTQ